VCFVHFQNLVEKHRDSSKIFTERLERLTFMHTRKTFKYLSFTVDKKEIQRWHRDFMKDCPNGCLKKEVSVLSV